MEEVLATYVYPLPNGTDYFEKDLKSEKGILILFDYCQILKAIIYDVGWEFIFHNYSLTEVIEIDRESGWFDEEDIGETIKSLFYHSLLSGFNPLKMERGKYHDESNTFESLTGKTYEIDWEEIYNLKNNI